MLGEDTYLMLRPVVCFSTEVPSGDSRLSAMILREHSATDPLRRHGRDLPEDGVKDIEMLWRAKASSQGKKGKSAQE